MDDNCQTNGIVFGDWKLVPVDSRNWELCHRHVARATGRHKGGTRPQWNRLGRFYQCNTFDAAIQYAADCELKDGTAEAARDIHVALAEYGRIAGALVADMAKALEGGKE
jgi:hypothetical protein